MNIIRRLNVEQNKTEYLLNYDDRKGCVNRDGHRLPKIYAAAECQTAEQIKRREKRQEENAPTIPLTALPARKTGDRACSSPSVRAFSTASGGISGDSAILSTV